jgi:hypothetical protein
MLGKVALSASAGRAPRPRGGSGSDQGWSAVSSRSPPSNWWDCSAQRLLDPVGEEADAGQRGHAQHQRDAQHRQFTGAPVAGQHAQRP